jgi:hypothetical protein
VRDPSATNASRVVLVDVKIRPQIIGESVGIGPKIFPACVVFRCDILTVGHDPFSLKPVMGFSFKASGLLLF